ncbi:hypothetical protein XENORESO_001530 [Xenotaenia resolanae]|uniref:Uncharacterized protein n=1 Tax=Xenotaenia resolanae TaxID=208358 RepID=A0ABV0W109_9TELE
MDSFDNLSASEKAEASELQKMIAIEQQKAQFQAQVRTHTPAAGRSHAGGHTVLWKYQTVLKSPNLMLYLFQAVLRPHAGPVNKYVLVEMRCCKGHLISWTLEPWIELI